MTDLNNLSNSEIVGLTMYGESRGESVEGQIAVGCVIRNRVHSSEHKSYQDICLAPLQFSCWNKTDVNRSILEELAQELFYCNPSPIVGNPILRQCIYLASGIIEWNIQDNTRSAMNYMASVLYVTNPPSWARKLKIVKEIGNHTFLV